MKEGKQSSKDYYDKHRRKISREKRRRYAQDEEYREKIKERARARYRNRHGYKPKDLNTVIAGTVTYRTVKYVTATSGISRQLLNYYMSEKFVPSPLPVEGHPGRRLFREDFAEVLINTIVDYGERRTLKNPEDMMTFIQDQMGAELKEVADD